MRGLAVMFCLLPATRLALEYWPPHEVAEASGLFNLMRNIGGAVGIAAATTILARMEQVHRVYLGAPLTPYDPVYQQALRHVEQTSASLGIASSGMAAQAYIYKELSRQAVLLSFVDNFFWFGALSFCFIPLVFLFRSGAKQRQGGLAAAH